MKKTLCALTLAIAITGCKKEEPRPEDYLHKNYFSLNDHLQGGYVAEFDKKGDLIILRPQRDNPFCFYTEGNKDKCQGRAVLITPAMERTIDNFLPLKKSLQYQMDKAVYDYFRRKK